MEKTRKRMILVFSVITLFSVVYGVIGLMNLDELTVSGNVELVPALKSSWWAWIWADLFILVGGAVLLFKSTSNNPKTNIMLDELSKGKLNPNEPSDGSDELQNGIVKLSGLLNTFTQEINQTIKAFGAGDATAKISTAELEGSYREVAENINRLLKTVETSNAGVLEAIKKMSTGHFHAKMKEIPGQTEELNEAFDTLQKNLFMVVNDIKMVVDSASAGKLDVKINADKYSGNWKVVSNGLNSLLDDFVAPTKEMVSVVEDMAKGNLDVSVKGDYEGEYANMKHAINQMASFIRNYVNEISSILNELSAQNFNVKIKQEYIGDFAKIKVSFENILENFNRVLDNIDTSAQRISTEASEISFVTTSISSGAIEQSTAVEQLNKTIEDINKQTMINAENALQASNLATETSKNAGLGNKEMSEMLLSMDGIKQSSTNILNVIKVIEDIAFQTNLLALNAAVEAARAGQYGKGFAVVAEEVRNLATRCQNAANETTELIEGTVSKVAQGSEIANTTAKTLTEMLQQIQDISSLIENVASASNAQAQSVGVIQNDIQKIEFVTDENKTISERASLAVEELVSQSGALQDILTTFQTRNPMKASSYTPVAKPKVSKPTVSTPKPVVSKSLASAPKPVVQKPAVSTPKPVVPKPVASAPKPAVSTPKPVVPKPATSAPKPAVQKPVAPASKPVAQKPVAPTPKPVVAKPTTAASLPKPTARKSSEQKKIPHTSGAMKVEAGDFGYQDDYNKKDFGKY